MPKKAPRASKAPRVVKPKVEKDVICGHEEVTHPEKCHIGELQDCDRFYWRCGGHGEHYKTECQKLCV